MGGKASVAEMLAKPATPPVSPPLDGAGTCVGAMLAPLGRAQTMLRCKCWATFHGFRVLSMRRHPRQFSVDRQTPTDLAATAAVGRRQRHPSHRCLCASGRFAPQPPTWRLDAEPLFLFAFRAAGLCCLVWSTGVAPSTSGLWCSPPPMALIAGYACMCPPSPSLRPPLPSAEAVLSSPLHLRLPTRRHSPSCHLCFSSRPPRPSRRRLSPSLAALAPPCLSGGRAFADTRVVREEPCL